ncbi:MAG: F0F1 ATP synthase subunit A [Bacteroidetes bacterium]|jgi:F-type H+-transporting ATPase subunit a|nr:F0F1 ATP synthase subunit A [Bacteroidota bacterium]
MEISPDHIIYWEWGAIHINATLVFSWVAMGLLAVGAWLITRNLTIAPRSARWQNFLEVVVGQILAQIEEAGLRHPRRYLPFIGTLFLFIVTCNVLGVIPRFEAPTASITTAAALALCVFVAVPVFGILNRGLRGYITNYIRPTPLMLPFNIIGEISRTLALAVRLFGNILSGNLIVAILLSLAPLFFPVVMQAFGLLIGVIQAYVFAVLALVYIASGARLRPEPANGPSNRSPTD